nr:uncharacterized protein CI109_006709 [Kwoniella shandongensis]KAA5524985.1 hypothetical protein CI109_006709 [Kwoniella shandongensis]
MPLSVQLFQEKHAAEFAHLHNHHDEVEHRRMLETEQARLEEARRLGRAKRQTMAVISTTSNGQDHSRAGWRPLSLLNRQQLVTKPSQLVAVGRQSQPPMSRQQCVDLASPGALGATPDLSSPLQSEMYSPDLALITPNQLGLALGCSSPPRHPDRKTTYNPPSSAHGSIQSSTYSWASSFSGETVELRAAAHYVPDQASAEGHEEVLDSPEKTTRRRKRIVALAHTVRQLEGVGSRDMEDPNFYHVLVKAWNERPGHQPQEAIWSPSKSIGPVDPYLAPPPLLAPAASIEAEIVASTQLEERPHSTSESYNSRSDGSYQSSNPFRYSYASTLHDLALEDGVQHGSKLMSEKAWLRSPLFDQGDYFNASTPSAPFPTATFQHAPRPHSPEPIASSSRLSDSSAESACVPRHEPIRPLRRQKSNIMKLKQKAQLEAPIDLAGAGVSGNSGANWGLGFLGNWLQDEIADRQSDREADFHEGEDGMRPVQSQTQVEKTTMIKESDASISVDDENLEVIEINAMDDSTLHRGNQDVNNDSMESIDLVLPDPSVPHVPTTAYVEAREYQYSTPCRRQSYSTPSTISYAVPLPHRNIQQTQVPVHVQVQTASASTPPPQSVEGVVEETVGDGEEVVREEVCCPSSETYSYPFPPPPHHHQPHHLHPITLLAQTPDVDTSRDENEPKTPMQPILPQMPTTPKWQLRKTSYKLSDPNPSSRTILHPNYDPSSYPVSSDRPLADEPEGVQAPDFSVTPPLSPGQAQTMVALPENDSRIDVEKGIPTTETLARPRTSLYLFILGFIIPGLWFIAGWAVNQSSPATTSAEGLTDIPRRSTWLYHPDLMIRASRWAAITSTTLFVIAGIVAAIVVTVT